MNPSSSAYTIFSNALELEDAPAREAYLEHACAGDAALQDRVEKLLQAHSEAGGFLAKPLAPRRPLQAAATITLPAPEKAGDTIGRYKLLEQIGQGGCGIVYMAQQQEPLRRRVALKVIKLGMDTRQVVARFEAERQALALMDHPNIARVLDAGATDSGRPFFVMELVRGVKITEYCDRKQLSTPERLHLFIRVCQAIQHAHQKGIIHRDLKPSNILVTTIDGQPVPKVIDFGIAKATNNQPLTDKTVFTAFEQFIGTPAYMSPEQAEMSGVDIDTRTDIYSLGVVLYELLTGKTPFDTEVLLRLGIDEVRRTIRDHEPPKPSTRLRGLTQPDLTIRAQARHTEGHKLLQTVKGDLDWIVMKCLEKDRGRRYEAVSALAIDIARHLSSEPILARPPSRLYEFQRTVHRHKLGFAAASAVIIALSVGLGMSLWTFAKERQSSKRLVAAEQQSRQQLYSALLAQARATLRSGELGQRVDALDALRRAAAISNAAELRGHVFTALALPDLQFKRDLPKGRDVTWARLDPAFERLALGRGRGPVEIRSVPNNRLLASLPASTNRPVYRGLWSPDGHFLAVIRDQEVNGYRATLEVWEVTDSSAGSPIFSAGVPPEPRGRQRRNAMEIGSGAAIGETGNLHFQARRVLLLHDLRRHALSFHPRLAQIIVGRQGGFTTIWDFTQEREIARYKMPNLAVALNFSPGGERFAALCEGGGVRTLSVQDTTNDALLVSQHFPASAGPGVVAWHPHGGWIAFVDETGAVFLMDSYTGTSRLLGEHNAQAVSAVFSPDGGYLFTGSWDRQLLCWDLRTMRSAFTIARKAFELQFNRDGRECALFTREGAIELYAFERPCPREFSEQLGSPLRYAAFSTDGRWLAASGTKRAAVWDLLAPSPAALDDDAYEAHLFFTPEGRELFGCRNSATHSAAFRWRLTPATKSAAHAQAATPGPPQITRLPLHQPQDFTFLTWFSNSIVMTSAKGSQALTPKEFERGSDHWTPTASGINGVSPDGQWLAIFAPFTRWVFIYKMPGLEKVAKLTQAASVREFEFSPRGDELAVSSWWGVEFWSTSTWQRIRAVTNFVRILSTPDARGWWLTKDAFTAGLYDARTLAPLLVLPSGTLPLALSPDGRHLAVSVDGRRLQLWDLAAVRLYLREMGLDWDQTVAGLKPAK